MSELLRYAAEQSGGLLIALVLISRVESKLDDLTSTLTQLTATLTAHLRREEAKSVGWRNSDTTDL